MLECYNPEMGTFFIPVGETELTIHKMYEVSRLAMGDISYEEYVPSAEELHMMVESDPLVYATY